MDCGLGYKHQWGACGCVGACSDGDDGNWASCRTRRTGDGKRRCSQSLHTLLFTMRATRETTVAESTSQGQGQKKKSRRVRGGRPGLAPTCSEPWTMLQMQSNTIAYESLRYSTMHGAEPMLFILEFTWMVSIRLKRQVYEIDEPLGFAPLINLYTCRARHALLPPRTTCIPL